MAQHDFKTGDTVKLKTGEPELPTMVINEWFNDERAICKWFDARANEFKKDGFHVSTLVKVN